MAKQCLSKIDDLYGAEWLVDKEQTRVRHTRLLVQSFNIEERGLKEGKKAEVASISAAHNAMSEFDYEKCMDICLMLIKKDFDHSEAHILLQEVFIKLGVRNKKVEAARKKLANLMLNRPETGL